MKKRDYSDLIYQVVRAKMLNKRRPIASTKDRSEVSGSGKKPWQQKGTGRARAGSIRSPLWKGGGITFGPRPERSYKKRVSKEMAKQAFNAVLAQKEGDHEIVTAGEVDLPQAKTKHFMNWLMPLARGSSSLVVVHKEVEHVKRAGRNVPRVKVTDPANVDILDLLTYKYLIATREALQELKERAKSK